MSLSKQDAAATLLAGAAPGIGGRNPLLLPGQLRQAQNLGAAGGGVILSRHDAEKSARPTPVYDDRPPPRRLPGCLELHLSGDRPLTEVRHAVAFVAELGRLERPSWALDLLMREEGRRRLEEILAAREFVWFAPGTAILSAHCPLPEVVVPLLAVCMAAEEGAPHLSRRTQALCDAVCAGDAIFRKAVPLLTAPRGSSAVLSGQLRCPAVEMLGRFLAGRVGKIPPEQLEPIYVDLAKALDALLPALATKADAGMARKVIKRCLDLLRAGPMEESKPIKLDTGVSDAYFDRFSRRRLARVHGGYDAPGALSHEGPRHSNDHENITQVILQDCALAGAAILANKMSAVSLCCSSSTLSCST